MKRIGELLLERGWVEPAALQRALATQRDAGERVCSLLVARGELDPDLAARALGEQHAVAAVLQKHLVHREEALASKLPASLARARVALPIGRMGSGEVIVCVRDPLPALAAELAHAMRERVLVAVAPARQLETLVRQTYGSDDPAELDELDVEIDLDDIAPEPPRELDALSGLELVELDAYGVSKDPSQSGIFSHGAATASTRSTVSALAAGSVIPRARAASPNLSQALTLDLDTDGEDPFPELDLALSRMTSAASSTIDDIDLPELPVSRHGRESLAELELASLATPIATPIVTPIVTPIAPPIAPPIAAPATRPAAAARPAPAPRHPPGLPPLPPLPSIPRPGALDVGAITRAPTLEAAIDGAMKLAAERWGSGLLFELLAGSAAGRRGFGPQLSDDLVQWIVLPLAEASLVQAAAKDRAVVSRVIAETDAQDRILRLVGAHATAIAIVVSEVPSHVLVVGEPVGDSSVAALEQIAHALGDAGARLRAG